ncbi:mannitol-1-phosphate 5-dehydrogenase [Agromyces sp. SYSU K20354]|uniref:mannitol-1-phosphate 5-dehydrogenase n=1 Tax=Agromyces cavernae TaxID=2898659 RepID=UPI001E2E8D1C|nr:mannitol-1-phosphate 5-dehydrogenase [Agromyces cavernae]MCD2441677.1 mannitol-1-phosphate 5-dehydrogenase [Agromyces cavernae]
MKAVHFGAGNIGRGFVGLILHDAGYEVVFADVNGALIDELAASDRYTVHEVGVGARDRVVDSYRAVNSATDAAGLARELATADVVTTAVGPAILRFIAPHVLAALRARAADAPPLAVMACENAINATDLLRDEVAALAGAEDWTTLGARAVFANTAVDRIVPAQAPGAGLDVTVETFFEWAIERPPFGDAPPVIPDAHFVDDLAPYIERKLFTVNTGHAATAYFGFLAGHTRISDALADPAVAAAVERVLGETSALIVDKHEFTEAEQAAYRAKILQRFRDPDLPDTVERVGRQPLRKLGRQERFVAPAAELAERGSPVDGLLAAVGAALRFDVPADPESVQLRRMLHTRGPVQIVHDVMGIAPGHPLEDGLVEAVAAAAASR